MSNMSSGEVLVVGGGQASRELGRWPVIARVDPDVVVVRADLAKVPEIARYAKLVIGRSPDGSARVLGDERVLDELQEGSRLFVEAWRKRPLAKPERPGEGLSWDSPGFEAP
jgi:hypothetical protein